MTNLVKAMHSAFDYAALSVDDALALKLAAERVREKMKRSAQDIVEIGQDLQAAKSRVGHGRFGAWLDAEFGMSQPTAENFMRVAEQFGDKIVKFTNMAPSVLYLLVAPAADDVREEVVEKVISGEVKPTVKDVQAAIANAKAEAKAEAEEAAKQDIRAAHKRAQDAAQALVDERAENTRQLEDLQRQRRGLEDDVKDALAKAEAAAAKATANDAEIEARICEAVQRSEAGKAAKEKDLNRAITVLQAKAQTLEKAYQEEQRKLRDAQERLREWNQRSETEFEARAKRIRMEFRDRYVSLCRALDGLRGQRPTMADMRLFEASERVLVEAIAKGLRAEADAWDGLFAGHVIDANTTLPLVVDAAREDGGAERPTVARSREGNDDDD